LKRAAGKVGSETRGLGGNKKRRRGGLTDGFKGKLVEKTKRFTSKKQQVQLRTRKQGR